MCNHFELWFLIWLWMFFFISHAKLECTSRLGMTESQFIVLRMETKILEQFYSNLHNCCHNDLNYMWNRKRCRFSLYPLPKQIFWEHLNRSKKSGNANAVAKPGKLVCGLFRLAGSPSDFCSAAVCGVNGAEFFAANTIVVCLRFGRILRTKHVEPLCPTTLICLWMLLFVIHAKLDSKASLDRTESPIIFLPIETIILQHGYHKSLFPCRPRVGKAPPERPLNSARVTALERTLREFPARSSGEVIVPEVGVTFDSIGEAYDFYNLYSWERGFGVRYGKSRLNVDRVKCMQEIVCGCSVSTCRTGIFN
jgi:hypothetical protein